MENTLKTRAGRAAGHLFAGLCITAIGVIFLLGNLGVIDVRDIIRPWVWPLILIALGVKQIIRGTANQ
jgi:uncharacterized integral membrane protein